MDNSDEPEDLLDGKIVFQKNKDRTFSKTKQSFALRDNLTLYSVTLVPVVVEWQKLGLWAEKVSVPLSKAPYSPIICSPSAIHGRSLLCVSCTRWQSYNTHHDTSELFVVKMGTKDETAWHSWNGTPTRTAIITRSPLSGTLSEASSGDFAGMYRCLTVELEHTYQGVHHTYMHYRAHADTGAPLLEFRCRFLTVNADTRRQVWPLKCGYNSLTSSGFRRFGNVAYRPLPRELALHVFNKWTYTSPSISRCRRAQGRQAPIYFPSDTLYIRSTNQGMSVMHPSSRLTSGLPGCQALPVDDGVDRRPDGQMDGIVDECVAVSLPLHPASQLIVCCVPPFSPSIALSLPPSFSCQSDGCGEANTFLLLMHGGASIMLWVCFEYRMNAAEYSKVLEEKPALELFKLKGEASGDGSPFGMTMTRSTLQRQYWNGFRTVLEWSSQSPEDK
ncbi:unnamed protein product [Pleuronectes platessa]|uniref:Uncharacterized protein n=1 Tax=Pleuronectes platessa TaxID=8262 RepID=A0A9N7Z4Q3_PLEPL|nr:unnamed protein product [Pleuronectes platessa]